MDYDLPSPAHEAELTEEILTYADDPLGFVRFIYPWGEAGTPLEGIREPRKWQTAELEALGDHVKKAHFAHDNGLPYNIWRAAYSSGRGPGKSGLMGMLGHWHVSTKFGAHTMVVSNTESQLRLATFPEIAKWTTLAVNRHWFDVEGIKVGPAGWFAEKVAKQLQIDSRYWGIYGKTWTEENVGAFVGPHVPYGMMVLFDEAANIADPFWNKADGFFTDPGPYRFWIASSQMRRASGRFYDLFFDPKRNKFWRGRMIDIREIPEIDQVKVQQDIEMLGGDVENDEVRIEIRGLPPNQGEQQFISSHAVNEAMQRQMHFDDAEPLVMAMDPAPRGRTAIRFRQGRNGRTYPRIVLNGLDNVQLADEFERLAKGFKPDALVIDAGMGTGVIDILKRRGLKVHEAWFGSSPLASKEWATRGTELWAAVRDWLPGGALDPEDKDLFLDLTVREWKWHGREDNKKILESKADLKKRGKASPDDGDAFALTFHVNPVRRDNKVSARKGRRVPIAEGVDEPLIG